MGVNMAGYCISDDAACRHAAEQEIIRRFLIAQVDFRRGDVDEQVPVRAANVMRKAGLTVADRPVVAPALDVAETTGNPGAALELPDGTIVTGKTSDLLGPSAAVLLNALKTLAGIADEVHLLSPDAIEPIQRLKTRYLGPRNPRLHTDEVLIALSTSAAEDDNARLALEQLQSLRGCDAHITTILGSVDEGIFRSLGVLATTEPQYWRKALYHRR